jgi:hypothetical protein
MQEGKQARTWNPHPSGVLSISYTHDGRIVTCGRDNQVTAWTADGTKLKSFEFTNELPVRATFTHDGARVVATDWAGRVTVWDAKTGKRVGELAANPPTIAEQISAAQGRLNELQSGGGKPSAAALATQAELAAVQKELEAAQAALAKAKADLTPKETESANLKAQVAQKTTPALEAKLKTAREIRNAARLTVTNAVTALNAKTALFAAAQKKAGDNLTLTVDPAEEMAALKVRLAKLKAGLVYANLYYAKESIAAKKREQEKLLASGTKADKSAAEKLAKQIFKEEKDFQKLTGDYEKLKSATLQNSSGAQARL